MSKPKPKKPPPAKPAPPSTAAAAYDIIKPEIDALRDEDLITINLDIPQSVSTVLGLLAKLATLRPAIVEKLPTHPIELFDKLEKYALAAWYAHLMTLPPASPSSPVKPLIEEGSKLREDLLGDAEALARRGLLDPNLVAEIRSGQGNIDTANDLVALSAAFTASWSEIEGKTAATLKEIERAGAVGPLLLAALGVRDQNAAIAPAEATSRRARAFTLFVRAYKETQRAVEYLRFHEGDADSFAPSLYQGRGGRGSSGAPKTPESTEPTGLSAPHGAIAEATNTPVGG